MKRIKFTSLFLGLMLIISPLTSMAANQNKVVGLDDYVTAYLIGNQETGDIYYEKNAYESMPIASLTKLMTYLLVKEEIDAGKLSLSQRVTASEEAGKFNSWEYSYLGLDEGETYTIEELLEGLIVASGNDCAYQLATTVSETEKEFVRLMNLKAEELGLTSQVYSTSSGLPSSSGAQNLSSARDLFKLSQYIIEKYPEILLYGDVRSIVDPRRGIDVESTIPLIGEIPGVDGLKTGTLEEAGWCLISSVDMAQIDSNDDFRTIGVVMGADQKDTRNKVMSDLIYYVSRYYDTVDVLDTNVAADSIKNNTIKQGYVDIYPEEDVKIIVKQGTNPAIKYNFADKIKAPVKSGDVLGEAKVSYEDEEYDVRLISKSNLAEASLFSRIVRASQDAADFLLQVLIAR